MIGPPGVGKGYNRVRLIREERIQGIEVKALIKSRMERDSQFHAHADALISQGILLEDHFINELIVSELEKVSTNLELVIDGSSRNVAQARFLREHLLIRGFLPVVTVFDLSYELCKERLLGRIEEAISNGEDVRKDDAVDVHRGRYLAYEKELDHTIAYFARCGTTTHFIDASKSKDLVYSDFRGRLHIIK